MPEDNRTCPKCNAAMKQGFILDDTFWGPMPTYWVEGVPQTRLLWGGVKVRGRRKMQIAAFRCTGCGALDLYANPGRG
jgi:hypothetical protein